MRRDAARRLVGVSVLVVGLCLMVSTCSRRQVVRPPGEWTQARVARDRSPAVTDVQKSTLAAGNNAFALSAYQELRRAEGNLVYSPLSVSLALAMVYAGAQGQTAAEMARALHYRLPQPALHQAFNWLDLQLAERGRARRGAEDQGFRLDIVNALFLQRGFTPLPSYLQLLARHYGTGVAQMDFARSPEPARESINAWVARQTGGRIADLLAPGSVDVDTRMVLANAVYFKAAWMTPFDEALTAPGTFHAPGRDVTVPMMRGTLGSLRHAAGDGYEAIALPYAKDSAAMVILLPAPDTPLEALETRLDADRLAAITGALRPRHLSLVMPRFSFHFDADMSATLRALGMEKAFTEQAELPGITEDERLRISAVAHKAFIEVNEAGTEAAAATGVVISPTSLPRIIEVNRPFVFFIHDRETGSVVFLGRVVDPS